MPSRRPQPLEAGALVAASGPRPVALVALVAIALMMMVGPVLVAGFAILDSNLLAGIRDWVHQASALLSYLVHARVLLFLPMAAVVARAKEDS
jgi:hypothetical protein